MVIWCWCRQYFVQTTPGDIFSYLTQLTNILQGSSQVGTSSLCFFSTLHKANINSFKKSQCLEYSSNILRIASMKIQSLVNYFKNYFVDLRYICQTHQNLHLEPCNPMHLHLMYPLLYFTSFLFCFGAEINSPNSQDKAGLSWFEMNRWKWNAKAKDLSNAVFKSSCLFKRVNLALPFHVILEKYFIISEEYCFTCSTKFIII